MPALFEEFRPRVWNDVVGQDKAVAVCRGLMSRGLGGRAVWISGRSGQGKTTIARLLAAELADALAGNHGLSMASPMLDTHAKDVNRFAERMAGCDRWILGALAEPESFGGLATLATVALDRPELQSFDYAPLSLWLDWWKQRGGKFGQRRGNAVHWEDGTTEDIRPEADRWKADR